jgi:hypothetical protein
VCSILLALLVPALAWAQQCTENQLQTEFTTDPTARGYATCAATDDQCVLTRFNAPCGDPACKVDQTVTRDQIWAVIESDELKALANSTAPADTARMQLLTAALANTTFDLSKAEVRQKWNDVFTAPSSPLTNAAIAALQQKNVPRSQIVCGRPATLCDVSLGRRGAAC